MGNDKQIKVRSSDSSLEQTKAAFLPQTFKDPEGKAHQYDLEAEYNKTRKNKPYLLYMFVAAFISLILIASVIIIVVIQKKSRSIELNIRDFEDVKLKELIDSSKKNEGEIDQLRRDIAEIDSDYRDETDRINQDIESQKDGLMMRDIPEVEKNAKLDEISKEKERRLRVSGDAYKIKRKAKEDQIAAAQRRLNAGGSSAAKAEKSFGDIFGGENKLFKMQIDKVSADYEKKLRDEKEQSRKDKEQLILLYNPLFKEKFVLDVMQKPVPAVQSRADFFTGLSDDLAIDNIMTRDQLMKLNDDMKGELAITGRLRQIPYKNSVQRAVVQSDSLTKSIFNTYDILMQKMVAVLQSKNQSLKYYTYALDYMTKSQQENGYILDPRDPSAIGIFTNKVHKIKAGNLAFVFRSDDDYIATVRFKSYKGLLVGEIVDKAPGRDLRPFDKIMFKRESEQK